jgi:arylsulfatase A-like enzyme
MKLHCQLGEIALTWILLMLLSTPGQAGQALKPNLLFLFADDQAYETIGALGHTDIETPNLDRLVQSGTTFTHAYNMGGWHGAICVASRTMLNTGRTVWRARELEPRLNEEAAAGRFWPQLLATAGYQTFFSGKWHVSVDATKVFQHARHIRPGMPKDVPAGYQRPITGQPDPWSPSDPKFGGFWEGGRHWSEVIADDAEDFFKLATASEQPFFMYLAFNAPHDPRQSPQDFVDRYPLERIRVPENFLPEYPHAEGIGAGRGLRDEKLAPWPRTEYAVKVNRQEYYAIITHMDAQIGRILDALADSGRADNTVIIFTADHGLAVGRHGLLGKQNMYEHSLRAPLILAGPGIPAGRRIVSRVYVQDVLPTTLELADMPVPAHIEFKSLLPLIRGERAEQYDTIYAAYMPDQQRAVIADDFKLIHYPAIDVFRLFNLREDPHELQDLIDDPRHAATLVRLKRRLVEAQRTMGDPLTAAE